MCKIQTVIFVSMMLLLSACGQNGQSATNIPEPTNTIAPSPIITPSSEPQASPVVPSGSQAEQISDIARAALARELNIGIDQISVVQFEEKEWSDTSLGCPQPGFMYPQVITPGYFIALQVGEASYPVHSDNIPREMIVCTDPAIPLSIAQSNDQQSQGEAMPASIQELTQIHLAGKLGINVDEVKIVRVEETEWRDSSLGCGEKGTAYLTVITPGYIVILEAQGNQYRYHTDLQQHFVQCDRPTTSNSPIN